MSLFGKFFSFYGDIQDNKRKFGENHDCDYGFVSEIPKYVYPDDIYYHDGVLHKHPYTEMAWNGGATSIEERYALGLDNTKFCYKHLADFTPPDRPSINYTLYKIYTPNDEKYGDLCITDKNQSYYAKIIGKFEGEHIRILPQFQDKIRLIPDKIRQALGIEEIIHFPDTNRRQSVQNKMPVLK